MKTLDEMLAVLALLCAVPVLADAQQAWPNRQIKLIVPVRGRRRHRRDRPHHGKVSCPTGSASRSMSRTAPARTAGSAHWK